MLTRRSVLEGCVALATAASARGVFARFGTHPDEEDLASVATLLVDARSSGRDEVARAAMGARVPVLDAGADLAPILYGLLHDWRRQTIKALAGFTSATSLFYIERFAYDWGLRTVFLARHSVDGEGARWVRGPECMLDRFAVCARLEGWGSAAVSTSLRLPVTPRPLGCSQAHLVPDMLADGALYSWTLMPSARNAMPVTPESCP